MKKHTENTNLLKTSYYHLFEQFLPAVYTLLDENSKSFELPLINVARTVPERKITPSTIAFFTVVRLSGLQ